MVFDLPRRVHGDPHLGMDEKLVAPLKVPLAVVDTCDRPGTARRRFHLLHCIDGFRRHGLDHILSAKRVGAHHFLIGHLYLPGKTVLKKASLCPGYSGWYIDYLVQLSPLWELPGTQATT